MISESFEIVIKDLSQQILSEPNPKALPQKIIDHVQQIFPVEWSTLWLTEWLTEQQEERKKRLKLAAASPKAQPLLTAEAGGPAVYDFGEGFTGYIGVVEKTVNIKKYTELKELEYKHKHKYDQTMYGKEDAGELCRCVLGVPLRLKSKSDEWRVIGVLKLENIITSAKHPEAYFTDYDVKIVEGYASVIAVALEKAQMREDSIRIAKGLLEISKNLLKNLGDKPNLESIVKQTADVISAQACALWLREGTQLNLEAAYGYPGELKNVPPYNIIIVQDDFNGVGLTVYVANKKEPLNLKSVSEVSNHPAWKGANDEGMWLVKKIEAACYSLVAIPLVDEETDDLKGVFKIENKQQTMFQLENFFTEEDQQLLTILGNSISLSLIMSERFERLKRLERLVSNIRVLDGVENALFFILMGLTHNEGLQYNRAIVFLKETPEDKLVCKFALGPIDMDEWTSLAKTFKANDKKDLLKFDFDTLFADFGKHKQKFNETPIMKKWSHQEIYLNDQRQLIARHAINENETKKYSCEKVRDNQNDFLNNFPQGDFVLIPMFVENKLQGIIYADNCFTRNRINQFELNVLDLFAGMAASMLQASKVPEQLREKGNSAWRLFSQPAAHRLGTETHIIDGEIHLVCKPQLQSLKGSFCGATSGAFTQIEESFSIIQESLARLRSAARDYQQLTPDLEELKNISIENLIREIIEKIHRSFRDVKIIPEFEPEPTIISSRQKQLSYVIEELLLNACKELTQKKLKQKKILIKIFSIKDKVDILVADTGEGIPAHIVSKLFNEPAKGREGGTGLGMLLIDRFMKNNDGSIRLLDDNEKPENYHGAAFLITLPGIENNEK